MGRVFITIEAPNLWAIVSRSLASVLVSQFPIDLRRADRTMTGSISSTSAIHSQAGAPMQSLVATTEELGQRTAPLVLEEEEVTSEEQRSKRIRETERVRWLWQYGQKVCTPLDANI